MTEAGITPPVVLLTDFGTSDIYAGVMKGVIAARTPGLQTIDLTHDIPPFDPLAAGRALLFSHHYFPAGTIFCCVVDPGVGSERRAIAATLDTGQTVVCPDNGLLTPLAASLGRVVAVDSERWSLPAAAATFHGRDLFAPVAAALAAGRPLEELGPEISRDELVRLPWPEPVDLTGGWLASVIHVDRFGNLVTNLPAASVKGDPERWHVRLAGRTLAGLVSTFADVPLGAPLAYIGSSGYLEVAVREGSAAEELGLAIGAELLIEQE